MQFLSERENLMLNPFILKRFRFMGLDWEGYESFLPQQESEEITINLWPYSWGFGGKI